MDDDVYLKEKLQHVGYKIYLLTDQPIRHKCKMNERKIRGLRGKDRARVRG
jgi:hypothetical protein